MKKLIASAALAAALVTSVPATAQVGYNRSWNSNEFWRGAPADVYQRISYLDQRINRGISDGSLTRAEARRAQNQLYRVRIDADRMRRNGFSRAEINNLQARLDNVARNVRWARNNENYRGDRDWNRYRTDYDAARYYRDGRYQERYLSANDEIFRGSDGRYYCRRSDGTTGLIVGGGAGAVLGSLVTDGAAGTLIGGAIGALLGRQIDRNDDIRCR